MPTAPRRTCMGGGERFFVPAGCDATTVNPLDEVAAQGVIGRVQAVPSFTALEGAARRPTPIFR